MTEKVETVNKFAVGARAESIHILMARKLMFPLSHAEAINLAAWLVAMCGPEHKQEFDRVYGEILRS